MSETKIIKVRPWMAIGLTFAIVVGWTAGILTWWPTAFSAPLISGAAFVAWGLRKRAMAVRFWILIPAERFGTNRMEATLAHESVHIRQQKELGFVRFMLWYLTPSGCVELEAEAFTENRRILEARPEYGDLGSHYAKVIKTKYLQVKWSKTTEADIRAVLEAFNRARAA